MRHYGDYNFVPLGEFNLNSPFKAEWVWFNGSGSALILVNEEDKVYTHATPDVRVSNPDPYAAAIKTITCRVCGGEVVIHIPDFHSPSPVRYEGGHREGCPLADVDFRRIPPAAEMKSPQKVLGPVWFD